MPRTDPEPVTEPSLDLAKLQEDDGSGGEWETGDAYKDEPDLVAARVLPYDMDDDSVRGWLEEMGEGDDQELDEGGEVVITDATRRRYLRWRIETALEDWPDRGDEVLVLKTIEEVNERGDRRLSVYNVLSEHEEFYCYARDLDHLKKVVRAAGWFLKPPSKKELDAMLKEW